MGKVSGNRGKNVERDSIPFDDELLIKRMERKRKKEFSQDAGNDNDIKGVDLDRNKQEDYFEHNKEKDDQRFLKGILGNPGSLLKDIGTLKQKMQDISRDFDQLNRMVREERMLGQHIDKLFEVEGNVEEVKNLMKYVPPLEAKNRNLDHLGKDLQKRMDGLDTRVGNLEKMVKKLVD